MSHSAVPPPVRRPAAARRGESAIPTAAPRNDARHPPGPEPGVTTVRLRPRSPLRATATTPRWYPGGAARAHPARHGWAGCATSRSGLLPQGCERRGDPHEVAGWRRPSAAPPRVARSARPRSHRRSGPLEDGAQAPATNESACQRARPSARHRCGGLPHIRPAPLRRA